VLRGQDLERPGIVDALAGTALGGRSVGRSDGACLGSRDEGRTWSLIADNLPSIWSVEAALVS